MDLGNLINAAKSFNLTDEQKEIVKKVAKEASGNKEKILEELKKHKINVPEDKIDMVLKMVDKL